MSDRYDWSEAKADWESGREKSFADLSAKYGMTEQAIRNRRRADAAAGNPWVLRKKPPKINNVGNRANNVVNLADARATQADKLGGGGKAGKAGQSLQSVELPADDSGPLECESEADFSVDVTKFDPHIVNLMKRATIVVLRRLIRGKITAGMHQSEADVYLATMQAAAKTLAIGRDVAGKEKGQPSAADLVPDDNTLEIISRRIESERAVAMRKDAEAKAASEPIAETA